MVCVTVDVGNTSTSIGRWENGNVVDVTAVKGGIRMREAAMASLRKAFRGERIPAIAASVVPDADELWREAVREVSGEDPVFLTYKTPMPLGIKYPNPEQIGADRLADAAGALSRYGGPVVVADFGTALTFDIVDAGGNYTGGVIAPGLPLMTEYLHERTAKLPLVELGGALPAWGDSTEHAMLLGAQIGYRGIVREIAGFIGMRTGAGTRYCATGGYASWALSGSGMDFTIDPDLTLYGLGVVMAHLS